MHSRRFACLIVGMWLAGGFFMAWVATQSFRSVDRLLAQPNPVAVVEMKPLGPVTSRLLLRYHASELNRSLFETWEISQIVGGAFFFFFLLFGTSERKVTLSLALVLLAFVLLQRFWLTPEVTAIGRTLDFVTPNQPSHDRTKFWILHSAYMGMEAMKWLLLGVLGMRLMSRGRGRSGDARNEVDVVNKTNYRHINR